MAKNWYPVIDYGKCTGCLTCVNFCPHGVYTAENGKPKVSNPDACVEFCKGCQKICPAGAINYSAEVSADG
ncbi:4Fe-4S ferredoxin [Thermotoga maritima MSB8]|uniref:Ferredoxin n=1 Tax=Thermotoga maritima (strain ATCC 43589 / DSM 3109 / JCM 10099 / NBRC 100826 / MSB8) TaxID=243274 RepID=Q9X0Q7_THEMA|nr:4Fe-4S binding protein [Thermotoga maritima]AAD36250.1 ferredoxin [Thermotoga maritima MSB8]AGL50106.1 Ferredoxin [Thermotoga maritima MSB8]AHD18918.1 4Fe-4S ferredoxin [Thermotoga maritima MSB8]AKE27087.1 4Fe-4S ferredoxin [Thermotoga maritima]AKE28952.1 4Fe-4S ferredoxin [Thermotoga maritima MSB8]